MKDETRDDLVPIVRIGLYIAAGRATAGGWLPAYIADMLPSPEVVEAVTGLILGAVTFAWYWASKARAALKRALR